MRALKFPAGLIKHYVETTKHKGWVALNLLRIAPHVDVAWWPELARRAVKHDLSKYRWDESRGFAGTIFELPKLSYGSAEYAKALEALRPCIALHYERNRHHPEWHKRGVNGMSPVDRIEMVADWAAAVRRVEGGDLDRSIEMNKKRFGYGDLRAEQFRDLARAMGAL